MRRLALAVAWLVLAGMACDKSVSNSLVVVTVSAPPGLPAVTQLQVDVSNAGATETQYFPPTNQGTPITFDTSFVLSLPKSRGGQLDLTVRALDAASKLVASASKSVAIVAGGRVDVTVVLGGDDRDGGVAEGGPEVPPEPSDGGGDGRAGDVPGGDTRDAGDSVVPDAVSKPETTGQDADAPRGADGNFDGAEAGSDGASDLPLKLDGPRDVVKLDGSNVATSCGNGKLESGELCDCGSDPRNLPALCKGTNGTFFGDGTGCSRTCTKEPGCLDASGANQACAAVCGDDNLDVTEACDDGNRRDGDGCSSTCTVESGFRCTPQTYEDTVPCQSGSGECLRLPIVYRDFQPENLASGGHPDYPFLGTRYDGSAMPTTICVPNAAGPAKGRDATARCWGIAGDRLLDGKPQPGATTACDCAFSDWNVANSSRIPGGYTLAGNDSPLSDGAGQLQGLPAGTSFTTTSTAGDYVGVITGYTASTPGGPIWRGRVPAYKNAASFKQWFNDEPSVNHTFNGTLELAAIGSTSYRFATSTHLAQGGFFPLDALNPSQATLCNLSPYWNHGDGTPFWPTCTGDQYLFPPRVTPADCPAVGSIYSGCWVSAVSGVRHDSYFTDEARFRFTYDSTAGFYLGFYGDDDFYVFVNGVLVLDLGGTHDPLPGQVTITGSPGDAEVIEGGCLDSAGNIVGVTAGAKDCSSTSGAAVGASSPDDFRRRTVSLGLVSGKTYEVALFGADRHPPESNYQLTVTGLTSRRSVCAPAN